MVGPKRRSTNNQNGGIVKGILDLPADIIHEILSRLPIELLMQCRSVCKAWNGLVQDPVFIGMHLSKSDKQPPRFILQPLGTKFDRRTLMLLPSARVDSKFANSLYLLDSEERKARRIPVIDLQHDALRVMCTCNGLLCIASDIILDPVFVLNPVIGKYVMLPSTGSLVRLLSHEVGLGYHSSSGTYKVVRAYTFRHNKQVVTKFEIITLGEKSWKKLSAPHGVGECFVWRVVYWRDALHWRIGRRDPKAGLECILSLDIGNEKFETISFPDGVEACERNLEILILDDNLTLVELENNWMKIWKVTGKKAGRFSLCCQSVYETNVRWGGYFRCSLSAKLDESSYLLHVTYSVTNARKLMSHFVHFSPTMAQYMQLDIPGLPEHFQTLAFKPSLVSPEVSFQIVH